MMITGEAGTSWARVSVAWMPSMIGMLTSINTMSGASFLACSTPSLPLTAVATTVMSGSKDSNFWRLSRVLGMSSTIRTLIGRLNTAGIRNDVVVDDRRVCMDWQCGILANHQVLGTEGKRRHLVFRELLNGHQVRGDLGRCRDVFGGHDDVNGLPPSNHRRASRGSANEQGPPERHDGEENTEDQEDAVALRLYLSRQSTHLLKFGAIASMA